MQAWLLGSLSLTAIALAMALAAGLVLLRMRRSAVAHKAELETRVAQLRAANEKLRGQIAHITERARAEAALQQSFLQLRQLTDHLETFNEDERKRIALDIHDELGQNLMALKIDIEMLHARIGARDPLLKRKTGAMLATLDATIGSVRTIINELHPSTLELGLCPAIEWLLAQFEKHSGIDTTLSVVGTPGEPADSRRDGAIYRIVQESLANIVHHAHASAVELTLGQGGGHLWITIVDDGIGMGPGDAAKTAAFGLRGIRERIHAFGGELVIDSQRGTGTTLSIQIPVDLHAHQAARAD